MKEREIKLVVGDELSAHSLELLLADAGLAVVERETREQTDCYFDTKAKTLLAAGVALRTRRHGAASRIACKSRGSSEAGLHEREEIELDWPPAAEPRRASDLPSALRERIEPFVLTARLRPTLTLVTKRRLWRAREPSASTSLEVTLDDVEARLQGGKPRAFRELEIEGALAPDSRGHLLRDLLVVRAGATVCEQNKVERALESLGETFERAPTKVRLPDEPHAGPAARALLLGLWHSLQEREVAVRTSEGPVPVHKMRVACRRARTALRLFADLYSKRQRAPIDACLKALGKALGRVRDYDVRAEALGERLALLEPRERDSLTAVLNAISALRAEDVFARADALDPDSAPERVHELRIAIKRLRYALEFAADVLPTENAPLAEQLSEFQAWLGSYNDAITAQLELPDRLDLPAGEELALAHALALQRRDARAQRARFHTEFAEFASADVRERLSRGG